MEANHKEAFNNRIVFSEKTYQNIISILTELRTRLNAKITIFADMNGYPIGYDETVPAIDITSLTALASGTFSATSEMAKMVQEQDKFRFIYLEGKENNIYMCNVSKDYLIIVLFDKSVAMGMVRILTHNTVEKLSKILDELSMENQQASKYIDIEFKSMLNKELDKFFGID